MSVQRALGSLFRRIRRPPPPFLAARRPAHGFNSSASFSSSARFYRCISGVSTWSKHHWDLMLGLILSGQTVIYISSSGNTVFAEVASVAEVITDNDQEQAYVTGLRRIEDGSVVSNTHTSKWRIFTDNGRDLFLKGKLDEAERFFQLALVEAKEGFGPRDPHVASSYNNLAELYRIRKAFEKAEPLYLEAINILEESFGTDDVRVGAALHNLGQFYLAQRKLEQAKTSYERALKIKGRILGYGHTDYANTMFHLGTVLHLLGKEKDSEDLIKESIRILEEGGQGESTTCVRRMRYLSQMLLKSNRLAEAESLQRKILHILEISKGWDSLETVIAAEGVALTLQSLGSLTEAQELLERCLDARKKILPQDHIQVAANNLHLARLAMLNSNPLRKSEAGRELDKANFLVNNSIRIANVNLERRRENQSSLQSSSNESIKEGHTALIVLLQSLDFLGLLEVAKGELVEGESDAFRFEVERALRDCITIFEEPEKRSLLNNQEVKREYLSCLKHLTSTVSEYISKEVERARELQQLIDEARQIEAELSPGRRQRN